MRAWLVLTLAALCGGCASGGGQVALDEARQAFEAVRDDPEVLQRAPRDVIRAGESLARAERLAGYWGNEDGVEHYAYLSRRYSEIARENGQLGRNQVQLTQLRRELARLQETLRESRLIQAQQQSQWLDEQLSRLATIETERGLVMTIGDLFFEPGRSELSAAANRTVLELVQFLQLNPRRRVRVEGYTDSRGDEEENRELSRLRAQAVAQLLSDLGIDESRIESVGYGEAYPVEDNASARGRAANRRVEILFSDEQGNLAPLR